MFDSLRRIVRPLGAAALAAMVLSACTEDLGSGAGCPALCPDTDIEMRDTVIVLEAPDFLDTTLVGLPPMGTAGRLYVASRGDTLQTYGVVRFDVLPTQFTPASGGNALDIVNVDSARVRILTDTVRRIVQAPVTIELYDVDTTAADTSHAAIAALIRPDRLVGSVTLPQDTTYDTLRVFISNDYVRDRIAARTRVRLGIAARSAESTQFRVIGLASTSDATNLSFVPIAEDGTRGTVLTVQPRSTTPVESPTAASQLADYTVVAIGAPPPPPTELAVGGMPSRRTYMRFELPTALLDSATIIRAQLLLEQQPVTGGIAPDDTIGIYPYLVTAGAPVTDISRAASLIAVGSIVGLDSLKVVPSGTGQRTLEVVGLLRAWQRQDPEFAPHALVLRTAIEDYQPVEVRFHSSEAAAALRPRLRIIYIPHTNPGLP